jgi:triacylglycerol lipase
VGGAAEEALRKRLDPVPPEGASDGIVPVRSQVWGNLIWAGLGDHLDVMGHFGGTGGRAAHVDWLCSGAGFDRDRFDGMLDAIARGMLGAEKT